MGEDMGPFAGMDPALVRAITSYGTPPYRKTVTVTVLGYGSYSFDSLPTTIDGWIKMLTDARKATPEEYRDGLVCSLEYEHGYYDSGDSASLTITYDRPETDAEMTERVNRGVAYVREGERNERATFEALKRKYGAA